MEILSVAQIKEAERIAVEDLGFSSLVLMERAALAVFDECAKRFDTDKSILVLAGRGNNGGDGLAVARLFHCAGYAVKVYLVAGESPFSHEAESQLRLLRNLDLMVDELRPEDIPHNFNECDLIIDALLGIGLNRPVDSFISQILDIANRAKSYKVAIDIPSGINADLSYVSGASFKADITVTFTRTKPAHHLYPAKAYCGEVILKDIGIPSKVVSSSLLFATADNIPPKPVRSPQGYKNIYGHVAVIGGSLGKSGAAVMASRSACRAGAGLVTCVMPERLSGAVMQYPELMSAFARSENFFTADDARYVADLISADMTLAIGPGLGRAGSTAAFVREIIELCTNKLIIDADALYALNDDMMQALSGRAVLTPHIGEFAHMINTGKDTLLRNRLMYARDYAMKYKVWLVLKSTETIISCPDGTQYISAWGTPALSKGGSGDILTGIIAGLAAQGYSALDASLLGCKIQGDAALAAGCIRGEFAVNADDIINSIGIDCEI